MTTDDYQGGQGMGERRGLSPGGQNFVSSKAKIEQRAAEKQGKEGGDILSTLKNHEQRIAHIENIKPVGTKGVHSKGGVLKQGIAFAGAGEGDETDSAGSSQQTATYYVIVNGDLYTQEFVVAGDPVAV